VNRFSGHVNVMRLVVTDKSHGKEKRGCVRSNPGSVSMKSHPDDDENRPT
jgi:hypothetical protein